MVEFKPFASPSARPGEFFQQRLQEMERSGTVKVLENEHAIVWDFKWKPGQKVARYSDDLESVAVFLESGTIRSATDRGATRDTVRSFGEVVYSSHGRNAYSREAVRGTPRLVIIQIK